MQGPTRPKHTASDVNIARVLVGKGLPENLLKGLVVHLQELEAMSAQPATVNSAIRAVETSMKRRRSPLGVGEQIVPKIAVTNAFKSSVAAAKPLGGVNSKENVKNMEPNENDSTANPSTPSKSKDGPGGKLPDKLRAVVKLQPPHGLWPVSMRQVSHKSHSGALQQL
jgi:hypothetical protein